MCVILSDDLTPSGTKLVTVRLQEFAPNCRAYLTLYKNEAVSKTYKTGRNQLMVVPFPHSCPDVTEEHLMLAELPAQAEDALFAGVGMVYPLPPGVETTRSRSLTNNSFNSDHVAVAQVGGYQASLVPDYDSLVSRVDWSQYSLHGAFDSIMQDMKTRYGHGYGFVVAQPKLDRRTDRFGGTFGWVWYGDRAVLPTAHEMTMVAGAPTNYDVQGWIINDNVTLIRWSSDHMALPADTFFMHVLPKEPEQSKNVLAVLNSIELFHPATPTERKPVELAALHDGVAVRLEGRFPQNSHVETLPNLISTPIRLTTSTHTPAPVSPRPPFYQRHQRTLLIVALLIVIVIALGWGVWALHTHNIIQLPGLRTTATPPSTADSWKSLAEDDGPIIYDNWD